MKRKMCLGGGLLLVASSAIISLAACSSFNLHKDNVIRNAADNTITVNGNRVFTRFTSENNTLEEGNYLIGGDNKTDGSTYFASTYNTNNLGVAKYTDASQEFLVFHISPFEEGSANWKIYDEAKGEYLYDAGYSTTDSKGKNKNYNYLRSSKTIDTTGDYEWIYKGTYFEANTSEKTIKYMKFNPSKNFVSCYSSGQSNLVLYKEEVGTQYTVSFETGVDGMTVNPQKISEGKYAKAPETLINGEKVAKSWYVLGDETKTPFNFETTAITQDITLVAIWEESTEKIVQFYDENKTTLLGEKVVNAGKTTTAIDNPTKEGYEFDKWVDEEGNAFDFSKPITKMTKLYATYKNLVVTSIADVVREENKTKYYRVEGEITTLLNDNNFTIDDGTGSILCFDQPAALKISTKAKVGNKIAITAKYTVFNNLPEMANFLVDTFEVIENDEEITSSACTSIDSISFDSPKDLSKLVKLTKLKLTSESTISGNNSNFATIGGVLFYLKDTTNLPKVTFKAGQLVNITGYTTVYRTTNEVIITSIEAYDVASDLVNSKSIDWVSFKYKSYEDGTYDSFSDIALNYTITMGVMNEPTFTEGGVILIKGTSKDWTYESTMSELPTANNSTIFVQKFNSIDKSAIGADTPNLSNQFTMRISFGSLENAKAHYETSFVIAPYFKVNDTYHIGNKIETSIKKAIPNSIIKGCKEEILEALANTLAN